MFDHSGELQYMYIIANWKSNKNIKEALTWLEEVGPKLPRDHELKIVVCPQFTDLAEVKKTILVNNYPLLVGSQDLSPFPEGSFTGEEAASLLKEFVDFAILGHSERRQNFSETDEMIAKKVDQALKNQITPLVCVQNESTSIPANCKLVAYEPIFAIGTGNPDTPENAESVAQKIVSQKSEIEVLYGGSVNPDNAKAFITQQNIKGLLIGKASLDPQEFLEIIQNCYSKL